MYFDVTYKKYINKNIIFENSNGWFSIYNLKIENYLLT